MTAVLAPSPAPAPPNYFDTPTYTSDPLLASYGAVHDPYTAAERIPVSRTALYITNLPKRTKPHHLAGIFAEPYPKGGKRGRERDAGISMIQIYTIPHDLASSPITASSDTASTIIDSNSSSKSSKWSSISTSLKRVLSPNTTAAKHSIPIKETARSVRSNSSSSSQATRPAPTAREPAVTVPSSNANTNTNTVAGHSVTIQVDEVDDQEDEDGDGDGGRASLETEAVSEDDSDKEDSTTVAYVHFVSDMYLIRARKTLSEITIGGREITYETKYVDKSAAKRYWAWWTRGGEYDME